MLIKSKNINDDEITFNMKKLASYYCKFDVLILAKSILKFS